MGGVTSASGPPVSAPARIAAVHDLGPFACGNAALDDWLKQRALPADGRSARTFVACRANVVIGYYALSTGGVEHAAVPGRLRRNMPNPLPIVILGRLAVDRTEQGSGIGRGLLKDALLRAAQASEAVGFRAILVHAVDEAAVAFYARYGFRPFPEGSLAQGTQPMFLPIEHVVASL